MGDGNRTAGHLDGFQCRPLRRMAHIDNQTDTVHLGDNGPSHAGQAGVIRLITAGRQQRLVVIGQLHEACAKRVADLDKADIILDWRGVLEPEEDGGSSLAAGAAHIIARTSLKDQLWTSFEPAVPGFDIRHHLAKILVIGDGDMHRIDPAFAHLPENLLRPVTILQAVNHMHGVTYDTGPDEI